MRTDTRRARQRAWTATDQGMLVLVKLVLSEDWRVAEAAAELLRQIRDPGVLVRMAARVGVAQAERPSELGRRAQGTLTHAQARLRAA